MFKIDLGEKVQDCVTGFKGVVTARADYLTGCHQYLVTPTKIKNDGSAPESHWFDEDRLKEFEELAKARSGNRGGPQPNPAPKK